MPTGFLPKKNLAWKHLDGEYIKSMPTAQLWSREMNKLNSIFCSKVKRSWEKQFAFYVHLDVEITLGHNIILKLFLKLVKTLATAKSVSVGWVITLENIARAVYAWWQLHCGRMHHYKQENSVHPNKGGDEWL